jgi:hypothetical protein
MLRNSQAASLMRRDQRRHGLAKTHPRTTVADRIAALDMLDTDEAGV